MSIATYIKNDLSVRLQTGQELPPQLTLDSLAEMYQVSFTPVRTAIAELIHEGLLEKGANRRLIATVPLGDNGALPKAQSLPLPPQDPYDVIAADLVQSSLGGRPVYLREELTAEKYNISRSAIRNIFHRLAGESILDHIPRRGWRLRPFRQEDLQAYVEVRESLELKALKLARRHLESDVLQKMLDANLFPKTDVDSPLIDESLHDYLIEMSGNAYIQEFFVRQGRYYRLLFQWEDHDRAAAIETVRQHREILVSLLNKNWATARKQLSHHILNNHPILNRLEEPVDQQAE
ncbi:FCD domain-containing protein [Planctomicrobium sp. SH527]|uniref:GntR family transcriptional regulator n=1 Tax=Planctomicrobium sp. SH527 TaxID=3448123 RepID=UPI003F5BD300